MSDLAERLEGLARWESVFTDPSLVFGEWRGSVPDESGAIQMPWYAYGPEAQRFIDDMYALGWVQELDWMAWSTTSAGSRLLEHASNVSTADAADLTRLLTTLIRRDRFSEGAIAAAFDSGLLTAIARRARELGGEDLPFVRYEGGGRLRLGKPRQGNATARSGYGPPVFDQCGYRCVYCGLDMAATFENWLQLSVDHVIPRQMKERGYDADLVEDITNLVTCCRACNDFGNRYLLVESPPASDEAFYDLRDRVFRERKDMILAKREQERAIYQKLPSGGPDRIPPAGESA